MTYSPLDIARASLDAGQVDDALEFLNKHLANAPDDPEGLRLRAAVLARISGREADALGDLAKIATPMSDDLRLIARLHIQRGDSGAARVILTSLWTMEHDTRDAETLLRVLLDSKQAHDALKLLDELPDAWTWRVWRGDCHVALGDSAAAIEQFRAAIDAMPDTDALFSMRAYLFDRVARLKW